ncbi:alpha/beta hydrolase [Aliiglaciecola lipolytica]|uniref:DUF676 domain-containing protein n=1 Tax=Aliiglaciecola lipolytica E3 TaxID=1127673 RepID=K6XQA4_9ALTE|nr:hypothetical protein [Aliiglaciecola lipolytica]GAC13846.1 hypothetical protein GLIP_1205 [Aliiglaciecola lipolytica E3]
MYQLAMEFSAKKLLFIVTLIINTNVIAATTIQQDLGILSNKLEFNAATSSNLYCYSPNDFLPFSDYPNGDYVASIASADNIIIFAHGFVPFSNQGKHSLASMAKLWRGHLDIVEKDPDSAYCVVTWDSDYGHDDKDEVLAKFLTVLIPAVQDRRIRLLKPRPKSANIVLVGHSAGGNYIKHSVVKQHQNRHYYDAYPTKQLDRKYSLNIVTMGTPHLGTEQANNTLFLAVLFKILNLYLENDGVDNAAGFAAFKSTRRGASMLAPITQNGPLERLNQQFQRIIRKQNIVALAGINDEYVKPFSAAPDFTTTYLTRASHDDFLRPDKNSELSQLLTAIYGGKRL